MVKLNYPTVLSASVKYIFSSLMTHDSESFSGFICDNRVFTESPDLIE